MIQFCEIINTGTKIRIVTRDVDNQDFNEPIEFDINVDLQNLEELILTIKNYLENVSMDRSN
jgi:hypothetical protein